MKMHRHRWTDEELIQSAAKYQHKGDWKRAPIRHDQIAYQLAIRRPEVFVRATAHMTLKANPYSGSYIVYAYEFSDRHVYIGLTFLPAMRQIMHMQRGPVRDHLRVCPENTYKILETGIANPESAADVERRWIRDYSAAGWTLLNKVSGGGLGTVQRTKWTKEAVMAEARKYTTKQEWIDNSQMSYRIAKREGWFDAASAHMPKRVLGVGAGVLKTAAAKEKMRQAKLGKPQSAASRNAKSEAARRQWAARHTSSII